MPIHQIADVNPKDGDWSLADDEFVSFIPMRRYPTRLPRFPRLTRGYSPRSGGDTHRSGKATFCSRRSLRVWRTAKIAIAHSLTNGVGFGSTEFHIFVRVFYDPPGVPLLLHEAGVISICCEAAYEEAVLVSSAFRRTFSETSMSLCTSFRTAPHRRDPRPSRSPSPPPHRSRRESSSHPLGPVGARIGQP